MRVLKLLFIFSILLFVSSANTQVKIQDDDTNFLTIDAPSNMAADRTYRFPDAPANGQFLTTDGSGNMSWAIPAGGSGDVTGPATSSANIVPTWSGNKTLQNTGVSIDGSNNMTGVVGITASGLVTLSGTAANISLGSNYLSGDGGDEGIFIDADGDVGIGSSTPGFRLTVRDSQANNYIGQFWNTDTGSNSDGLILRLGPNSNPTTASNYFVFRDGDGTTIGTIEGNGGGGISLTGETLSLGGAENSIDLHIDSAGKVGIGTTSPTDYLEVQNNQNAGTWTSVRNTNTGSSALAAMAAVSDAGSLLFGMRSLAHSSGGDAQIVNNGSTDMSFHTGGSERLRLDNGGPIQALAEVAMNSNKITGLATPTAGADAATKDYVDASGGGGSAKVIIATYFTEGGNPSYCTSENVIPGGWVEFEDINENAQCDTGKRCVAGACVTGSPTALEKRVFVTSTTYNGALGGQSGADSQCASRASAAGLSGTFKAWIGYNSSTDPNSDFTKTGSAYYLMNGSIKLYIAVNWTDLTDGNLLRPINYNEFGNQVSSGTPVWTNVYSNGVYVSSSSDCSNFTSTSGSSYVGDMDITDSTWSRNGSSVSCVGSYHLYCFEQ